MKALLPADASTSSISRISLAPIAVAGATEASAWLCWIAVPLYGDELSDSQLHVARTQDDGASWIALPAPLKRGLSCAMYPDATDAASALLLVSITPSETPPCATPLVFLTADRGASWREVAPAPELPGSCKDQFALAAGRIFSWNDSQTSRLGASDEAHLLYSTADAGANWRAAISPDTNTRIASFGAAFPDGRLIAFGRDAISAALFQSDDHSQTWRRTSVLPDSDATLVADLSPDTAPPHSLYAVAQNTPRHIWQWDASQGVWLALPGIPHTAGEPDPLDADETTILGVGAGGGLLVAAPAPAQPSLELPGEKRLWRWNPAQRAWLVGDQRIGLGAYFYGVGWSGPNSSLWFIYLRLGIPPHLELYRLGLPLSRPPSPS